LRAIGLAAHNAFITTCALRPFERGERVGLENRQSSRDQVARQLAGLPLRGAHEQHVNVTASANVTNVTRCPFNFLDGSMAMTGKNRIMIHGPRPDTRSGG
jgi:hypothetical protein